LAVKTFKIQQKKDLIMSPIDNQADDKINKLI